MKTAITVQNDGGLHLRDITDEYNWTSAYNQGKRGLKKAHAYIEANRARLETISISKVCNELDTFGLKMRMYCAMD